MKKLILKKEYKIIKYVISEEDEPFACGEFDPDKTVAGDIYAAAVRERISSSDTYFCDIGDTRHGIFAVQ